MAWEQRYKGTVRNGKVELDGGAIMPDGAEVIVLFHSDEAVRVGQEKWDEALKVIESFRGKVPLLPAVAYSTESLYD